LNLFSNPLAVRYRLYNSIGYFFLAWAAHYFPFYLMGRQLFLHHYLPAHLASCLVTGALTQFLFSRGFDGPVSPGVVLPATRPGARSPPGSSSGVRSAGVSGPAVLVQEHDQTVLRIVGAVIVLAVVAGFLWFAPLTYGAPGCSVDRLMKMKWLDTWDFHFTK
jgi:dolichyl-phosphate-mannose-protein mannosyltransferase